MTTEKKKKRELNRGQKQKGTETYVETGRLGKISSAWGKEDDVENIFAINNLFS